MMDWSFSPEVQAQYDRVTQRIRELQKELGITPLTIEQRHQKYILKKQQEEQKQKELQELNKMLGQRRPKPNWKI